MMMRRVTLAQMGPDDLLSPNELGDALGLSTRTIYSRLKAGLIPHMRIGRQIRVRVGDLEEYLHQHRVP